MGEPVLGTSGQGTEAGPVAGAGPAAGPASSLALWTLVLLAVVAPWPFGSVPPAWSRGLTAAAFAVSAVVAALGARRGGLSLPAFPMAGALGLVALAGLQLVPLPPWLHRLIAPGSHHLWHPADAVVAEVLGAAWRPLSIDPAATASWAGFASAFGLLALLASPALVRRRTVERAAWAIAAAGAAVAVYGIVARVAFGPLLYGRFVVPTVMPFGPFVNKNHFAAYVLPAAVVALGLGWGRARAAAAASNGGVLPASALVAYGAAGAMVVAVLLSLSRAGALGLAAGVVALVFANRFARRGRTVSSWRPLAAAAAVVVAVLLSQLPAEVYGRLGTLARWREESAATFRVTLWGDSLSTWWRSPWMGFGLGAYAEALPPQKTAAGLYRVQHAENDWLELAVEGGSLGLMLAALAAASLGAAAVGRLKALDRVTRGVVCGALSGTVGLAVHALFDFPFHIPAVAILFLLLGALCAGSVGPRVHGRRPAALVLGGLVAAAVVAVLLGGRLPDHAASRTLALRAAETTDHASRRLRLALAEESLRRDIALRPADPEGWMVLAWARRAAGAEDEAQRLAAYALSLDPQRPELRTAVGADTESGGARR